MISLLSIYIYGNLIKDTSDENHRRFSYSSGRFSHSSRVTVVGVYKYVCVDHNFLTVSFIDYFSLSLCCVVSVVIFIDFI
jgi:hypothetical protein